MPEILTAPLPEQLQPQMPDVLPTPGRQVQVLTPADAAQIHLDALKMYAYAVYTPNSKPHLVETVSPTAQAPTQVGTTRYYTLARCPRDTDRIPQNLQPYWQTSNGCPPLSEFQTIGGFFILHEVLEFQDYPPPIESAQLMNYDNWLQQGPILDFGSFTPNPIMTKAEKLATLRALLTPAFDYAAEIGAERNMIVVLAKHVRDFADEAGILYEILGGNPTNNPVIRAKVHDLFPNYWYNDPQICRFIGLAI